MSILLVHSTQYFTCIQPPGVGVATTAVCKHKGLHSPLSGLLWHVLDEVQPPLEAYHGLINGNLPTKVVCSPEVVEQGSINGLNLYSGSCPGCPLGIYLVLSVRRRKRSSRENRSRFKMLEKVGMAKGHFVDHASSICGSTTNPITITMARISSTRQGCVVFSPMLEPLRSETALWCQYTAERSG